jgi:hypothetical protein
MRLVPGAHEKGDGDVEVDVEGELTATTRLCDGVLEGSGDAAKERTSCWRQVGGGGRTGEDRRAEQEGRRAERREERRGNWDGMGWDGDRNAGLSEMSGWLQEGDGHRRQKICSSSPSS